MPAVELEESLEMRCTLYGQFSYEDDYRNSHAFMSLSEDDRRRQREQDKEDFLEWLWLRPLAAGLAGQVGLDELKRLRDFASECGVTGERSDLHHDELEAFIKDAVDDDLIVPVIDRTEDFSGGRLPAESSSRSSPYDGLPKAACSILAPPSGALNSVPILPGPHDPESRDPLKVARSSKSARDGGNEPDWLGVAKAVLGSMRTDGSDSPEMLRKHLRESDDSGSPLASGVSFDYEPGVPASDGEQIAGMPFNGEPGAWISSMPGTMPQMRQYGFNGTPLTDFDLEAHHGNPNPHAHNWNGYSRDEGAPVSLLPW